MMEIMQPLRHWFVNPAQSIKGSLNHALLFVGARLVDEEGQLCPIMPDAQQHIPMGRSAIWKCVGPSC